MTSSQPIDISRITIKSVILLGILGSIVIIDYVIFKAEAMMVTSTGTVINISGRQRMLTRQVGALTFLLSNADSVAEEEELKKQILNNIDLIEISHNGLINGDSVLDLPKLTSKAVQRIYFSSPYYLDKTLRKYLDHLKAFVTTPNLHLTTNNQHLHFVKTELLSRNILTGLDKVVNEHEYENKKQLNHINVLKDIQVVSQISLLLLSGIFLFCPLIIKLKQQADLLAESEESLAEAEYFVQAGHWVWNIAQKKLHWSDEIYRIFGCRPNEFEESFEGLLGFVQPNDREMVNTAVDRLLKHNEPYNIEHRIVLQNGDEKIVHEQGKITRDAHGNPLRLFGTVSDITQIKQKEKMLTDMNKSYSRFVPVEFLWLLGKPDIVDVKLGDHIEMNMSILFSDIRDFTAISEQMLPEKIFSFINSYLSVMEPIIFSYHGIIDKYMGDAIMALFPRGVEDATRCAIAMQSELSVFNQENRKQGLPDIKIGIGINTGKLILGTVGGLNRMDGTVISDAVNLASRIEDLTKVYRSSLLISESVYFSLSKTESLDIRFVDRVVAKGKLKPVSVYEVFSSDSPDIKEKKLATRDCFEEALCLYHFKRVSESQKLLEQCLQIDPDDNIAQIYLKRCRQFNEEQVHFGVDDIGNIPQWDDTLLVHVSQIDQQHKELFRRIGLLVEAVIQRKGSEHVEETLSFLELYTKKHFKDEEELMLQHEYPHYPGHKAAHTKFIESLDQLKKERNQRGSDSLQLLLSIHSQVINWLMTHIKHTDTKFARFLKEKGVTMN